jgi:hypothetical protein
MDRIASVLPCKNAFVIAGSYTHSTRPADYCQIIFYNRVSNQKLTIEPKVRCLERHLHKGIGAEPMAGNEVLTIAFELQSLAVVLADQVTDPRLRKPYARAQFWGEVPLQLLRRGIDLVRWRQCPYRETLRRELLVSNCGGNLLSCPRGGLYAFARGDRGAWNKVGAEGLMERARSIKPSVKMSAANL